MLSISEFAAACGTSVKTIRFYDNNGLLPADYVSPHNGYRYYRKASVAAFKKITALKEAGFSLAEMRKFLDAREDTDFLAALEEKIASLEHQRVACARCREEYLKTMTSLRPYTFSLAESEQRITVTGRETVFSVFASPSLFHRAAKELAFLLDADQRGEVTLGFETCKTLLDGRTLLSAFTAHLPRCDASELALLPLPQEIRDAKDHVFLCSFLPDTALIDAAPIILEFAEKLREESQATGEILFACAFDEEEEGVGIHCLSVK